MRTRSRAQFPFAMPLALAATCLVAGSALAAEEQLLADLDSANEVIAEGDPDPRQLDVTAEVSIYVDDETGRVCFLIHSMGVGGIGAPTGDATAAHVHVGGPTVNGPVVVSLWVDEIGIGKECRTASEDVLDAYDAILANPAGYYVDVHSTAFPAGLMRGQLMPWPNTATVTPAKAPVAPILPALLLVSAALAGLYLGCSLLGRRKAR